MNKFERFIIENGLKLGSGASRTAYLYNDKVYKILMGEECVGSPSFGEEQSECEKAVYEHLIQNHQDLIDLLPKTDWFGRVCVAEYCGNTLADICGDEDAGFYDVDGEIGIGDSCRNKLKKFLVIYGDYDIIDNLDNLAINHENKLKIIDWGCLGW